MHIPSVPLSSLSEGERAAVVSVHLEAALAMRLSSMGIIPGTPVTCVRRKKESLIAVRARGAVIAMRLRDAGMVMVKVQPAHER